MNLPLTKTRIAVLAGALGAAGALSLVAASASPGDGSTTIQQAQATPSDDNSPGDISGNCDEAEHANDPECRGVNVPATPTTPTAATTPTTTAPGGGGAGGSTAGTHTLRTPGGTVSYRSSGGSLTLVSATPMAEWSHEVEQASGREIELDFRYGTKRVQVNIELEDGAVRERVRLRDADGTDIRTENGVVVRDDSASTDDDSGSGSGSSSSGGADDSGHGGNSGSGSDGHGSDDSGSDDHGGGSSGPG